MAVVIASRRAGAMPRAGRVAAGIWRRRRRRPTRGSGSPARRLLFAGSPKRRRAISLAIARSRSRSSGAVSVQRRLLIRVPSVSFSFSFSPPATSVGFPSLIRRLMKLPLLLLTRHWLLLLLLLHGAPGGVGQNLDSRRVPLERHVGVERGFD